MIGGSVGITAGVGETTALPLTSIETRSSGCPACSRITGQLESNLYAVTPYSRIRAGIARSVMRRAMG
jgi:hypothetical protein